MEAGLRAVMSHPGLQTIRSSAVVAHAGLVDVVALVYLLGNPMPGACGGCVPEGEFHIWYRRRYDPERVRHTLGCVRYGPRECRTHWTRGRGLHWCVPIGANPMLGGCCGRC